jgi:archaellum component FlaF (FlaF/FlaG flagellin family)
MMMHRSSLLLVLVFSILAIIGTITAANAQENNNIVNANSSATGGGQRVSFLTDDKVQIVGTYYPP